MIRTYRAMSRLETFLERYSYLKLKGVVGNSTFGYDRYLNQALYASRHWKQARDLVILRDNGCDLGTIGYEIYDKIIVHHINPITIEDVELDRESVFDPEFLVCTTSHTHNAIHYSDESLLRKPLIERKRNDTTPWKGEFRNEN